MQPDPDLTTVGQARRWAAERLAAVTDRPHTEAERLLAHVLQVARTTLLAHPEWSLRPQATEHYLALVQRRAWGTPLPYLTGEVEFYGLALTVTPDVLIPRPETELLVALALERLSALANPRIVEIGTGSGCIAVALTTQSPRLHLVATDLSGPALRIARQNAQRHGVAERITWLQTDLLAALRGPVDLIVSNPPYVAETEWDDLPAAVRREPRAALLGGPQGLSIIERLVRQAGERLAAGGYLLVEIGERQGEAALALSRAALGTRLTREAVLQIHQDLAGKDRILEVRLTGPANEAALE